MRRIEAVTLNEYAGDVPVFYMGVAEAEDTDVEVGAVCCGAGGLVGHYSD